MPTFADVFVHEDDIVLELDEAEIDELEEGARTSLSRIMTHAQSGRSFGIISSRRENDDLDAGGTGRAFTDQDHARRHKELKAAIKAAGYGYAPVKGNWHGSREKSIMVIGRKVGDDDGIKDFLMKHGAKYGQDAVVHKPHDSDKAWLWNTVTRGANKAGTGFELGRMRPQKTGKFGNTELKSGGAGKPGKTAPSMKSFVFSDGKNRKAPNASDMFKPGKVRDNAVWTPPGLKK